MAIPVTRQNSTFLTHRLPNGLQLLGQLMPDVQSAAVVFWVKTGTRDENPSEMGVSHFLEHMAFRRSKRFTGDEIDRAFEEMGADHNAGTWKEMTFYWVRVLGENVPRAIDVLTELTHPSLEPEDFDGERKVIIEEIKRYDDMPSHVLLYNFLQQYFGAHPLAWETLGTEETIRNLTVEQMRDYWDRRYGSENMVFAIAGNFDWDSIVSQLQGLTNDWERGETGRYLAPAPVNPSFGVHTRNTFQEEQIAIGTPLVAAGDPRYYAAAILATILGDDSGSRLYWAIHETGIGETAVAQLMDFEDNGLLMVHIATDPERAAEALRVARNVMKDLQENGIQEDELERAKAKLETSVIVGGESTNERVMGLIHSWLTRGRLETLDDIRRQIESVTAGDVQSLLEQFPIWPSQVVTASGPLTESDLRRVIDEA